MRIGIMSDIDEAIAEMSNYEALNLLKDIRDDVESRIEGLECDIEQENNEE